jgi:ribosomal protein S18 acetylase RimI-like enzyme
MKISFAVRHQLNIIRNIALATWPTVYNKIISMEQIEYMLEMMYSEDSLENQFNVLGHTFFISFDEKNEAVGFASCSPVDTDAKSFKLHKLYVLPTYQGKGAGKSLMDAVMEFSKSKNAERIELQVNKKNTAVDFYRNNGFSIYRELVLDIGNNYVMDDYLMEIHF